MVQLMHYLCNFVLDFEQSFKTRLLCQYLNGKRQDGIETSKSFKCIAHEYSCKEVYPQCASLARGNNHSDWSNTAQSTYFEVLSIFWWCTQFVVYIFIKNPQNKNKITKIQNPNGCKSKVTYTLKQCFSPLITQSLSSLKGNN